MVSPSVTLRSAASASSDKRCWRASAATAMACTWAKRAAILPKAPLSTSRERAMSRFTPERMSLRASMAPSVPPGCAWLLESFMASRLGRDRFAGSEKPRKALVGLREPARKPVLQHRVEALFGARQQHPEQVGVELHRAHIGGGDYVLHAPYAAAGQIADLAEPVAALQVLDLLAVLEHTQLAFLHEKEGV